MRSAAQTTKRIAGRTAKLYNPSDDLADLIHPPETSPIVSATGAQIKIPSLETWIFECSMTFDPQDDVRPFKKFPRYDYLDTMIHQFLEEDRIAVPKSRQMMCSWFYTAAFLWYTVRKEGRFTCFISKKEDDAGFAHDESLLARAWFVLGHLPQELKPLATKSLKPPIIKFPAQTSTILAMSQNAEGIRGLSPSGILWDEAAFQENIRQAYRAAIPTQSKGGKLVLLSTPNGKVGPGSLFYDICMDRRR